MKKLLFSIAAICMIALGSMFAFAQNRGGGGSTSTAPYINSFKASAGYAPSSNSSIGAVWVEYKMNSVATPSGMGYAIYIDLYNKDTGKLMYHINGMYGAQKIDFDYVPLATNYHVDFTVVDAGTRLILDKRFADVSTPKSKPGI